MRRALVFASLLVAGCPWPSARPDSGVQDARAQRVVPMGPESQFNTEQLDVAKVRLDLNMCRGRIREYKQINDGKNPPDLAALGLRLSFPADLIYDPVSGTVKSRTYPAF